MILQEIYTELNNGNYSVVENEIKKLNKKYRDGIPEITDPEYDKLIETFKFLCPDSDIFKSGVIEDVVNPDRAEKLKYPMYSLDKEKFIADIHRWLKNKGLPLSTILICTAKYDGISILKDEWNQEAWSRGDGLIGETMHMHYVRIGDKATPMKVFTIGELLFPKHEFATHTFLKNDGTPYKNARNMMAGLKNSDTISDDLQYVHHVRYGFATEDFTMNKSEELDFISTHIRPVPYRKFRADELDTDELTDLFVEWGVIYDLDGLVFDIDDKDIRKRLGRESNNNPAYARAFKNPDWATKTVTKVTGIEWNLSKNGAFKPVVLVEPFDIDGVTIRRSTGYNARFIQENQIGENSLVTIIRSGSVIPAIINIEKIADKFELPTHCPHCQTKLEWNNSNVDLICNNEDCPEVKFLKVSFFFVNFKIDGFAEKSIRKFFEAGYDTVAKIMNLSVTDISKLDGMGNSSAKKILKDIEDKIKNNTFPMVGHSSGCFENLGSRKLQILYDGIKAIDTKDTSRSFAYLKDDLINSKFEILGKLLVHEDAREKIKPLLLNIKGMSDKSVDAFLVGLIKFGEFVKDLDINIAEPIVNVYVNDGTYKDIDLTGREFCFTGVRDSHLKDFLIGMNAIVKDGISKSTTDLITKEQNSTSSKAVKARENGATVWQIDELKETLK